MKTMIFSLFILFSPLSAHAENYLIEHCEEQLARQGSGLEQSAPDSQCRQRLTNHVPSQNRFRLGLSQSFVLALGHAISLDQVIGEKKQSFYISGSETRIEEIIALRVNNKNLTDLMVINQSEEARSIYHFNARYPGNIAPQGVYESDDFSDAIDIDFNLEKGLIYVLHQEGQRISIWDSHYHLRHNNPENRHVRQIGVLPLNRAQPKSFVTLDSGLIGVYFSDGKIVLYDKTSFAVLQTMDRSIDLNLKPTLDRDHSGEVLILLDRKTIIDEFSFPSVQ